MYRGWLRDHPRPARRRRRRSKRPRRAAGASPSRRRHRLDMRNFRGLSRPGEFRARRIADKNSRLGITKKIAEFRRGIGGVQRQDTAPARRQPSMRRPTRLTSRPESRRGHGLYSQRDEGICIARNAFLDIRIGVDRSVRLLESNFIVVSRNSSRAGDRDGRSWVPKTEGLLDHWTACQLSLTLPRALK